MLRIPNILRLRFGLQQILNFALLPKVNEALATPLYRIQSRNDHDAPMEVDPSPNLHNPDDPASDSNASLMDTSSKSDSSYQDDSEHSMISVEYTQDTIQVMFTKKRRQ